MACAAASAMASAGGPQCTAPADRIMVCAACCSERDRRALALLAMLPCNITASQPAKLKCRQTSVIR